MWLQNRSLWRCLTVEAEGRCKDQRSARAVHLSKSHHEQMLISADQTVS
jgi:hypothetical protein